MFDLHLGGHTGGWILGSSAGDTASGVMPMAANELSREDI